MDFSLGGGWHAHIFPLGIVSLSLLVVTVLALIWVATKKWTVKGHEETNHQNR